MPSRELTNLILALLHSVVGSRHRCHSRRGGRCHRRTVLAPAPPPSPPSAVPHCRVLERLLSPSPDRSVYRPMEPLDPNASPWGRRRRLCAVHGWGCPNRVTPDQGPSSSSRQGEEEGGDKEDDEHRIAVVTSSVGAPMIHRTACISISPRGQPPGCDRTTLEKRSLTLMIISEDSR
jgi:hypothetical protein